MCSNKTETAKVFKGTIVQIGDCILTGVYSYDYQAILTKFVCAYA